MTEERFQLLLEKYLDATLSGAEREELTAALKADASRREILIRELVIESAVRRQTQKREGSGMTNAVVTGERAEIPGATAKVRPWPRAWAAAVFLILGIGVFALAYRPGSGNRAGTNETAPPLVPGDEKPPVEVAFNTVPEQRFDSNLPFSVMSGSVDTYQGSIGQTPSIIPGGVPVPASAGWYVYYEDGQRFKAHEVASELIRNKVPGFRIHSESKDPQFSVRVVQELQRAPQLRMLGIEGPEVPMRDIAALSSLEQLSVAYGRADVEDFKNIAQLTHLKLLRLKTRVTDEMMHAIASLPLEKLDLRGCTIDLIEALRQHPTLQELDLSATNVDEGELLSILPTLPKLQRLQLGNDKQPLSEFERVRKGLEKIEINGSEPYAENSPSRDDIAKEALSAFTRALNEAPSQQVKGEPRLLRKLRRRISFEMNDMPLAKALKLIEAHCGCIILMDPTISAADDPPTTLRVTDMSCDLALSWIMKLADREMVIVDKAVVVTSIEHARKLRLERREVAVSTPGAPWTADELQQIARLLTQFPIQYNPGSFEESFSKPDASIEVAGGKLRIDGDTAAQDACQRFIEKFANARSLSEKLPAWVETFEEEFEGNIDLPRDNLIGAVANFHNKSGITIILDPVVQAEDGSYRKVAAKGTYREALLQICAQGELTLQMRRAGLFLSRKLKSEATPAVFTLTDAIKGGAGREQLQTAIRKLMAESGDTSKPVFIRDHCAGMFDVWTLYRISKTLERAAKTGKVELEPAPWFYSTLKYAGATPLPRPGEDNSPGEGQKNEQF